MQKRSTLQYWLGGVLILLVVVSVWKGPDVWRQWRDVRIVAQGENLTAVVQSVEPVNETNPSEGRWRYVLLVKPPNAAPYRAVAEIDGFLVPGDTEVNVAVDLDNPEAVVIIP